MNKLEIRELLVEPLTEYAKEKIANDLEVLETLKKYLYVSGDSITDKIKLKWDSIDKITDKEDFNKVKKFLEE